MSKLKFAIDNASNLGDFVNRILNSQTESLVAYAHPCGGHVLQVVPSTEVRKLLAQRDDVVVVLELQRSSQYDKYPVPFDSANSILI